MTWYIIGNANIDATKFLGTTNNQSLVIKINSASDPSEKMRVNPDGNVGIGRVPAPDTAYRLDVAGIINATDIHKNGSSVVGSQWSNVAGGLTNTGGNVSIREGVLRWGNSIANPDSIELGAPDGTTARIGTPFIDFHYLGRIEDFNTRIINDANGRLSIIAPTLNISNNANVQGNLHVTGAATKPGGGWWTASSDARLKKSVAPLKSALGKLLRLRGVSFEWKEPEKQGNLTGVQMGLIAQEVEEVFPEWIDADPSGYKHLTVRGFEALTVEAVTFSSPVGPSHPAGLKEDAGAPSASSVPGRLKQAGMIRG